MSDQKKFYLSDQKKFYLSENDMPKQCIKKIRKF